MGFAAEWSEVAGPRLQGALGVGGVELIGVVEVLASGRSAAEREDLVAVAGDDDVADAFGDLVGRDTGVGVAADDAAEGDAAVPEQVPELLDVQGPEAFGAGDAVLAVEIAAAEVQVDDGAGQAALVVGAGGQEFRCLLYTSDAADE